MLLTPRFLFRFAVPCRRCEPLWTDQGAPLTAEHAIPGLAALDHEHDFAEVRAAWSPAGLAFWVQVTGKTQPPWCREARPDESDGLRVWIDTRDTKNIHRASRFCQAFIFMPAGAGRAL